MSATEEQTIIYAEDGGVGQALWEAFKSAPFIPMPNGFQSITFIKKYGKPKMELHQIQFNGTMYVYTLKLLGSLALALVDSAETNDLLELIKKFDSRNTYSTEDKLRINLCFCSPAELGKNDVIQFTADELKECTHSKSTDLNPDASYYQCGSIKCINGLGGDIERWKMFYYI